jgi:hypothetical protein
MSFTYSTFLTALSQEIAITSTNPDFLAILPTFIQNAELRIFRDLDLLSTVFRDTALTPAYNQRSQILPQSYGQFVVVEGVNFMNQGVRLNALTACSRELIDGLFPTEAAPASTSSPRFFARDTDQTILVAPSLGNGYTVPALEIVGTVRPTPLSATNTTTFISQSLPDLLLYAAMVEATGWMKNYGAQAEDPKMGMSWESRYQGALGPALSEETRKKFQSGSWSAKSRPMSQPERV